MISLSCSAISFTACYGFEPNQYRARSFRALTIFWAASSVAMLLGSRIGQDIAIQRAIARSKPFGAQRCAAAAAIVDRQLQGPEQTLNLPARRQPRRLPVDAGHCLTLLVQRREPAVEKIAINRALVKAGRDAETCIERQFLQ